jgi:hypothetical protein
MKPPRKRAARTAPPVEPAPVAAPVRRGRKALGDAGIEAVSAQTTVNFRPSVLRRVDRVALVRGVLRSDFIRTLVDEALVRAEAACEPAELAAAERKLNRKAKAAAR